MLKGRDIDKCDGYRVVKDIILNIVLQSMANMVKIEVDNIDSYTLVIAMPRNARVLI